MYLPHTMFTEQSHEALKNHTQIFSFPELEYAFKKIKRQGYKRNDEFRL